MPVKNSIKTYIPAGYYHVYNRGINKRTIFKDKQDYNVFLDYLKTYLCQRDDKKLFAIINSQKTTPKEKSTALKELALNNYFQKIELVAYCLMNNHFHLLIKQTKENDMQFFLQSIMARYTVYFNRRHQRTGGLFQGRYRAVLVDSDSKLLHLSRYIHKNPEKISGLFGQPSSYPNYIGKLKQDWVKPDFVLQNFSETGFNSYQSFVESADAASSILKGLTF